MSNNFILYLSTIILGLHTLFYNPLKNQIENGFINKTPISVSYNNKNKIISKKWLKNSYKLNYNIIIDQYKYLYIFIYTLKIIIFITCIWLFIETNDQFNIIFNFSNINQPFFYKFCSLWSFHEGSLFLWNIILLILNLWFILKNNETQWSFSNIIILWILNISSFFWQIFLFTSNAFLRYEHFYENNIDLNPILQDIVLAIHPPLLYIGYIGSSMLFILILLTNYIKLKYTWKIIFTKLKILNLISWQFLTIGILLGSWWAYNELGWGGWWFWDPVENISLIPWIFSLIILHLNFIDKKIYVKYYWIFWLSAFTFLINILGTCFIRSGLLNSVHMFATDNLRGFFLFLLLFQIAILILQKPIWIFNLFNNWKWKNIILFTWILFIFLSNIFIIFGTFFLDFFFEKNFISPSMYNDILYPGIFLYYIYLFIYIAFEFSKISSLNFFWLINIILNIFLCYFLSFYITMNINILIFFNVVLLQLWFYKRWNLNSSKFFYIHILISFFITVIIFQNNFNYEFLKILKPGDQILFDYYKLIFNKPIFNKNLLYNSTISHFNIMNLYKTNDWSNIFIEKRFYYVRNIFVMKHNIYSNLLTDFQIFLNSGNIFNGWLFKIKQVVFINFLWLFGLLFYIILILIFTWNLKIQNLPKSFFFIKHYFK